MRRCRSPHDAQHVLPPNGGLFGGSRLTHTTIVNALDTNDCGNCPRPARHLLTLTGAFLLTCMTSGCSGAPSRSILGSYFPSWMVCALVGLAAALGARVALKASGLLNELPAPLVVLLSIGCAATFALWLLWLA